jgi:hypothetical protein
MTDSPGLPPEEERVRRLLADARHDGPAPPEVVARLDEALAVLISERGDAPLEGPRAQPPAPVVDLGARRRRMAGVGLLAAAAVVVAGVAIGQALPRMQGSDDASTSGGVAAESDGAEREFGGEDGAGSDSGGAADDEGRQPKTYLSPGLAGFPELFTFDERLDDDLLDLRDAPPASSSAGGSSRASVCEVPGVGRGRRVVAQIDGALGLVVFRRADGATQQVDLYVCDDPVAVRTLTLPAP